MKHSAVPMATNAHLSLSERTARAVSRAGRGKPAPRVFEVSALLPQPGGFEGRGAVSAPRWSYDQNSSQA